MAERTNASHKQSKKASNDRPPARSTEQASQLEHLPDSLADLPPHSTASQARQDAVLRLQHQLGNNYVQRQIARQADGESDDVPVSAAGLGLEGELEGHPFHGLVQREDRASGEVAETLTADVTLKLKSPKVKRPSESKIQADHGQGIAGYTKPTIKFAVPEAKKYHLVVEVSISFDMDLAKEYKGGRLQVLRDHEDAHIKIAQKVANEHVIKPLKTELEALSEFNSTTKPQINPLFTAKYEKFKTEEGAESDAFDAVDYPRMKQAYLGVKTSLADLASGSPEIKAMSAAMDAFNNGAKAASGDADTLGGLTRPVVDAQAALSADNLARLQYNQEFKKKVAAAQKIVAGLMKDPDKLAEGVKDKLDDVSPILGGFTWQPDIS